MKIKEITDILEEFAPLEYQEEYDNSGLLLGNPETEVTAVLCCVDVNEKVLDEALKLDANLIIAHHPVIFKEVVRITGQTPVEKIIEMAIKKDIAVIAAHTNIDNVYSGVNKKICDKLDLQDCKIMDTGKKQFCKIITFVPENQAEKVRTAIFKAGAGHIGNYDCCSFNIQGEGTFRGSENTNPYVGKKGEIHFEKEIRIETILPRIILHKVIEAMINAHPYEEVAYDVYSLENDNPKAGSGMMGTLDSSLSVDEFLRLLKKTFKTQSIRYCKPGTGIISKVAVCGGSGSFLVEKAMKLGADAIVTGDVKYHQFFDFSERIMIADIGHYESEQYTQEIFYDLLTEKFPKFAVHLSKINTNPINYYN